ncbi:MAG: hypothetical protein VBE63_14285 [Lamprobacter sp.]|uniref:hypothetical protein n=1 Tax=Lamprobacter sp. TaxID=3100796 RepID=UPI002B25BAA6|nr:hypothetical protein [Lamprobacter sp.]MEA3641092.1 hypothetical protein [Lamprobacter sp.]
MSVQELRLPLRFADLLVFLIPVTGFIEFNLIGRLFLPDLLLIAILPLMLARLGRLLWQPLPRTFLAFGVLWLISQALTDLILATPFDDLARGWAKITFTLLSFMTLYLLIDGRYSRILLYLLGLAVGGLLAYFFNPGTYAEGHPWKFGIGVPVTLFFVVMASITRNRRAAVWLMIAAGVLNVLLGYRSLGGICLLTALLLPVFAIVKARTIRLPTLFLVGAVLITVSWGLLTLYEQAAKAGILGEQAQEKYLRQSSGSLGLILGGRSGIFGAIAAIKDSPIIGHGSWAKDCHYYMMWAFAMIEHGYQPPINILRPDPEEWGDCLIPSHSHILGAWLEAGFVGALVWFWLLLLIAKTCASYLMKSHKPSAIEIFVAILLAWDILFSPFGAERRFVTPYYIVVVMYSYRQRGEEMIGRAPTAAAPVTGLS